MKRQGQVVPGDTSDSQTGVLRRRVEDAGLRHGDTARIRVKNVRAQRVEGVGRQVFFCGSTVELLEKIEQGDGGNIPQTLVEVPRMNRVHEGIFDIEGVLRSNGRLTLTDVRVCKGSERPLDLRAPHFTGTF